MSDRSIPSYVPRGGPLQGVRVLELTKVWAGPFAGKLLAFLGAQVIRVESVESLDTTRSMTGKDWDNAPGWQAVNPEKLSVQIDIKKPDGRDLFLKLVKQADIVIENMRPGAMERLGLSYDALRQVKPDIICISMGMYGNEGPLAYQTGYAPLFAALGGVSALVGYEGEPPVGMNIRYGDSTSGTASAFAATVALNHRQRTGEGQFVDISFVEVLSTMISDTIMDYSVNGAIPACDGNRHSNMAPHGAYRCRDDAWIAIAIPSDAAWSALTVAMGDPALGEDATLATLERRQARCADLDARIGAWTADKDANELALALQALGVPAAKSFNSIELTTDADLWADDFYPAVTDLNGEPRTIVGPSWKMSSPAELTRGSPALGHDNDYVLGEILGYSVEERTALTEAGITC
ncbi:CaiB/BaiF CoA transferase family protein [Sphingobium sp. C100]|uniref:CaiB/BaiF CoA transferase family protein n=1 Tax=Sphingobium sp. C100 TaxID=1207055 RepID=UPI0003F66BD1|nr:CaiB/BaiF CoA-transferase family protein [Sphingobium sp. C100]